jgi:hypothetical protein
MPNQKKRDKIPWPGDWVFFKNFAYQQGWIKDSSGTDALNAWAETATEEEWERQRKRSYSYGWFIGWAGGYKAMDRLWKLFFGDD